MKMKRLVVSLLGGLALVAPAAARADELQFPNLVPAPPVDVRIAPADVPEDPTAPRPGIALRFATVVYNMGLHPLDLNMVPLTVADAATQQTLPVRQCIFYIGPACQAFRPIGHLTYHPAHDHYHLDDYAHYALVPVTAEGLPDFDAEPITQATQSSSCLIDTNTVPNTQSDPTALYAPYTTCTNIRQGISAGRGNTLAGGLPGQQLVIDTLPTGTYAIVITINPTHRLYEVILDADPTLGYRDNRSWAVLRYSAPNDTCHHNTLTILRTGVS